jgi:hypothetical protein
VAKSSTRRVTHLEGESFVVVGGMTIAKRGKPGSPHAGRWMALEPGLSIVELEGGNRLQLRWYADFIDSCAP